MIRPWPTYTAQIGNSTLTPKAGPKSKASVRPFGCFVSAKRKPKRVTQQSAVGADLPPLQPNASASQG
jgi:hypothetical protein